MDCAKPRILTNSNCIIIINWKAWKFRYFRSGENINFRLVEKIIWISHNQAPIGAWFLLSNFLFSLPMWVNFCIPCKKTIPNLKPGCTVNWNCKRMYFPLNRPVHRRACKWWSVFLSRQWQVRFCLLINFFENLLTIRSCNTFSLIGYKMVTA